MEITEKEFAIIQEISNNNLSDQRSIALKTGISLGLTNLIMKRLITKGYLKSKQLNKKKIQYLITPKGFSEKARKSYGFTLKTIGMFKSMRSRIKALIEEQYEGGVREIEISGNNTELANITELIFNSINKTDLKYFRQNSKNIESNTLVLTFNIPEKSVRKSIDLVKYLSDTGLFYQ